MGKPAARISDMHMCPMVTPGTPPIPHVGGPILPPGTPTVLIGGLPAATLGAMCVCTGPPDSIIMGSMGVLIGGKPAARMGDPTAHGGSIVAGCPTVLIGETSPGAIAAAVMTMPAQVMLGILQSLSPGEAKTLEQGIALTQAAANGSPFCEECERARAQAAAVANS